MSIFDYDRPAGRRANAGHLQRQGRQPDARPLKGDRRPKAVYTSIFPKDEFHLSPDGHLIAYGELRDGKWEVFVASFPAFHDITQVSQAGGVQPRWRGDGKELFFLDSEGAMMSVTVDSGSPPKVTV